MKEIELTRGYKAIVDDDVHGLIGNLKWHSQTVKNSTLVYARRNIWIGEKRTRTNLHWFVLGQPKKGFMVDHINGNGLDNRRENLRIVTCRENQQNCARHRNGKLAGIDYRKDAKLWRSRYYVNGKQINLGYFKTPEAARKRYLDAITGNTAQPAMAGK